MTKAEKAEKAAAELAALQGQAAQLGIDTTDMSAADIKKAIKKAPKQETPGERDERKGKERKADPVAKPKKPTKGPVLGDLYPWALNRRKVETAHKDVYATLASQGKKLSQADIEQAVMDSYTAHGGLVRNQEKDTTIGRRKPIKPGQTTDDVINGGDDDGDE